MEDLTFSSTTLAKIVLPSFSVILIERIKGHLAVCIRTSLEEIVTTISFKTSVIANSVVIVLLLLPNCLAIT